MDRTTTQKINKDIFLVCLGCYKRIPFPGCLIKNRNLFLTVQEAGKAKIQALEDSVSAENLLPSS